jgi:NAD(P)-dependent dehydrogenase (short-subunit alcohol dehydrogenase family)
MSDAETGLSGRVAVVTGAASGLGRAEALALAAAGADVVLGDLSAAVEEVADRARAAGVKATTVIGDVGATETADALVGTAIGTHGRLDVVVNNAGFTRDKMIFGMSDEEFDSVVRVHLRGHFLVSRAAAQYWREQSKATAGPVYGRLVNTASEAWLFGSPGQPNYAAAKAGIAALTIGAARGLARYGVRANVICPRARTAMTADVFGAAPDDEASDPLAPEHVATFVAWLAAPAADAVNGQVFVVHGAEVTHVAPPTVARRFVTTGPAWTADSLAGELGPYFAARDPADVFRFSPDAR